MAKQSYLPEHMMENTIDAMSNGDEGFTVPWAMWADLDGKLWINRNYTVHPNPGRNSIGQSTIHLHIKRVNGGVEVYENTIGDHRFSLGSDWTNGLPVVLV